MKHRYKSIEGAVKKIRQQEKLLAWYENEYQIMNKELVLVAKLASEMPGFYNPQDVWAAKKIRDRILGRKTA